MNTQSTSTSDLEKIFSSNEHDAILQSLELIRDVGNEQTFDFLLQQLQQQKNREIQQAIVACLVDVKNPKCAETLCSYVSNSKYSAQKSLLFSIAWQSALDFSRLSNCAITSICTDNFETAFEAYTLLEHIAHSISDENKKAYAQELQAALLKNSDMQKEFLFNESIALVSNGE